MSDLNHTTFIGHLGAKPELRHTATGMPVTNFNVASSRIYYNGNDEKQEETTWVRVVAWGGLAQVVVDHLDKGSKVAIDGRLQTHRFVSRESQREHSYLQVVASSVHFLSPNRQPVNDAPMPDDDLPTDDE